MYRDTRGENPRAGVERLDAGIEERSRFAAPMRSASEPYPRFNRRRREREPPRFVLIEAVYGSALLDSRPMVRESDWQSVEPSHFPRRRSAEAMAAWRRSESISVPRLGRVALLLAAVLMAAFFGPLFSLEAGFF